LALVDKGLNWPGSNLLRTLSGTASAFITYNQADLGQCPRNLQREATITVKKKTPYVILHFTVLMIGFLLIHGGCSKRIPPETNDAKAFQVLKAKMIDPKTGLPQTLDPNLFTGDAKAAYGVAKEIPKVLAQLPCFCDCEAYGHENLLDCFIDNHGED